MSAKSSNTEDTKPASVIPSALGDLSGMADILKAAGVDIVGAKSVTRQLLKQADGVPFAVRITSHIYRGQEAKKKRGGTEMAPANLCHVVNMTTGEDQSIIVNTVLHSELCRAFPGHGYVGKYFVIKRVAVDGKRYKGYVIQEFVTGTEYGTITDPASIGPAVEPSDAIDADDLA
jgi:hypothetical protein